MKLNSTAVVLLLVAIGAVYAYRKGVFGNLAAAASGTATLA